MYCLGLSTTTYTIDSHVLLYSARMTIDNFQRRVNRVPTLDGGAFITDGGYSAGDLTLQIRKTPESEEEKNKIQDLLKYHQKIIAATHEGLFLGTVERIRTDRNSGEMQINILVKERLDGGL